MSLLVGLAQLVKEKKLAINFTVAHFNHGLRGQQSNADERFVKQIAKTLGFAFITGKTRKLSASSVNLEEHAREERYDFLQKAAIKTRSSIILTAHTLDDQAETFLLRLIRGSGADGLGAMRAKRPFDQKNELFLVRPLLSWAFRKDTENFCKKSRIEYRHDEMNEDERFQRVKVRKKLLPVLKEFNPRIISVLAQTAFHMQSDSDVLNKLASTSLAEIRGSKGELPLKSLLQVPDSLRLRVLRLWLGTGLKNLRRIDSVHVEAILNLATSRKSGRMVELPGQNCVIKEDGKLFFAKTKVEKSTGGN